MYAFQLPEPRVPQIIPRKVGMNGMGGFSGIDGFRGMDRFIRATTLAASPAGVSRLADCLPTTLAAANQAEAETRSGQRAHTPPAST